MSQPTQPPMDMNPPPLRTLPPESRSEPPPSHRPEPQDEPQPTSLLEPQDEPQPAGLPEPQTQPLQSPEPEETYDASDITVLEGLEAVRVRPGMYIGGTGLSGLQHMIIEILDNAVDEAMAGHCDTVDIAINEEGRISVSDNGRGIPVDPHPATGVSALETVMTTLHAGGKFGGGAYKVSGGLHGVGASVVNALSSWLKAEVRRDGYLYVQEYSQGFCNICWEPISVQSAVPNLLFRVPHFRGFRQHLFSRCIVRGGI